VRQAARMALETCLSAKLRRADRSVSVSLLAAHAVLAALRVDGIAETITLNIHSLVEHSVRKAFVRAGVKFAFVVANLDGLVPAVWARLAERCWPVSTEASLKEQHLAEEKLRAAQLVRHVVNSLMLSHPRAKLRPMHTLWLKMVFKQGALVVTIVCVFPVVIHVLYNQAVGSWLEDNRFILMVSGSVLIFCELAAQAYITVLFVRWQAQRTTKMFLTAFVTGLLNLLDDAKVLEFLKDACDVASVAAIEHICRGMPPLGRPLQYAYGRWGDGGGSLELVHIVQQLYNNKVCPILSRAFKTIGVSATRGASVSEGPEGAEQPIKITIRGRVVRGVATVDDHVADSFGLVNDAIQVGIRLVFMGGPNAASSAAKKLQRAWRERPRGAPT